MTAVKPVNGLNGFHKHDHEDIEAPGMRRVVSTGALEKMGMRITFQDVEYTVINSQDKKSKISLLQGVSGYLNPGEMSALMGPSGSGKTTLLDVLAGRKTVGTIEGQIAFAGVRPTPEFLRRYTGYVEQFDTLLGTLTVAEMLMYTAELKCSMSEPRASKAQRVEKLLDDLNLQRCRDVRIGTQLARGISGGQAKRVNIGIALVTNPRVLFLDEPTSGLDSYTANEVMKVVKDLLSTQTSGITICSTIHSPTPYCFRLFDRMMILLRGQVVYFGERGEMALEYFKGNNPGAEAMQEGSNEAEWIVDLTTHADRDDMCALQRHGELVAAYQKSDLKRENEQQLAMYSGGASTINEATMKELSTKRATVTPFWWAIKTLFVYRTLGNYRNPEFLGPRIGDKFIFSLLIMTLYWHVGKNMTSDNVINQAAVLFMWCALPAFGASAYVPSIVLERGLYIRERNDGLYRPITYLCSKMVDELMIAFVASLVFSCVVFFPLKLSGLWVLFWMTYYCTLSIGIVLAYLVAALSPNMEVANAALPTYVVTLLFFAGFLLRWKNIPNYWKWYADIDFLHYAWGALMQNQFKPHPTELFNGQPVLEYYYLHGKSQWLFLLYESFFFVAFFCLAFLALQYKNHSKR